MLVWCWPTVYDDHPQYTSIVIHHQNKKDRILSITASDLFLFSSYVDFLAASIHKYRYVGRFIDYLLCLVSN